MERSVHRYGLIPLVALFAWGCTVLPARAQQGNPSAAKSGKAENTPDRAAAAMAAMAAKAQAVVKEAASKPTPRAADGHPDLSGYWVIPGAVDLAAAAGAPGISKDGKILKSSLADLSEQDEIRGDIAAKKRIEDPSLRPAYKPAFVAKVRENFEKSSLLDPSYRCMPAGVPRVGQPAEIAQTPGAVYFLYVDLVGPPSYRVIPTDGRKHGEDPDADAMAMGDSVGHWEGDTLVVDVVNISQDTWLDHDGAFHDENLHVIERFTRQGNALKYEVTVEDPTLFEKPWSPKPKMNDVMFASGPWLVLGKAGQHVKENYPCVELDQSHLVTNEHH
jgi:hypothetical protein